MMVKNLLLEDPETDEEKEFYQFTTDMNREYFCSTRDKANSDIAFEKLKEKQDERKKRWPELTEAFLATGG